MVCAGTSRRRTAGLLGLGSSATLRYLCGIMNDTTNLQHSADQASSASWKERKTLQHPYWHPKHARVPSSTHVSAVTGAPLLGQCLCSWAAVGSSHSQSVRRRVRMRQDRSRACAGAVKTYGQGLQEQGCALAALHVRGDRACHGDLLSRAALHATKVLPFRFRHDRAGHADLLRCTATICFPYIPAEYEVSHLKGTRSMRSVAVPLPGTHSSQRSRSPHTTSRACTASIYEHPSARPHLSEAVGECLPHVLLAGELHLGHNVPRILAQRDGWLPVVEGPAQQHAVPPLEAELCWIALRALRCAGPVAATR